MAVGSGTIDSSYVVLVDGFPECGQVVSFPPLTGGVLGAAAGHNQATAKYPVGTKCKVYSETNKGWATLTYLRFGTACGTAAAALGLCGVAGSADTYNSSKTMYVVNNDPDVQLIAGGPAAVLITAMTDGYYGWFWTGGVCPEDTRYVPALAGNMQMYIDAITDGNQCVAIGDDVTADEIAFIDITAGLKAAAYILSTGTAHA